MANLRDNIRARRLVRQINEVQDEIESHDMEEMAKARRNFEEKYKLAKEKEDNLRVEVGVYVCMCVMIECWLMITFDYSDRWSPVALLSLLFSLSVTLLSPPTLQYGRIRGELDTLQQQVEKYDTDLKKNFKDINKRYTDQLIKVKVALISLSLNDCIHSVIGFWHGEQWPGKVRQSAWQVRIFMDDHSIHIDTIYSAIMKYHTLKMEEVNDIMKHLWNKTYQGTGNYLSVFTCFSSC